MKALANLMGVSHNLTAPYNPSANGLAERIVGLVKMVLSKVCGGNLADFDLYLPAVQAHVNAKISQLTKTSPTEYVFARAPNAYANSPLLPVFKRKPGGGKAEEPRVCADTRGVNEVITDFEHWVPDILALFLMLSGFLFASALDLTKSFHQFMVHPDDRHMLAFTWRGKRWQFKGAPFGVKIPTAVFQAVMESIFSGV
jgi:hypothetical protein